MITPSDDPILRAWFDAGVKAASRLDGRSAAVLVGRDPLAVAQVALGLAQAITPVRRVALGDLIGDAPAFVALAPSDDVHGIVDSFLYGVSLNAIARQAPDVPNLFVLPSGSEDVQREEILTSDRWRRLAAGFREVQALLVLCTTADAPGVDELVVQMGGAVLVGADVALGPDAVTITTVLADLRAARRASIANAAPVAPPPGPPVGPRRPTTEFKAILEDAMTRPTPASSPASPPAAPPTPPESPYAPRRRPVDDFDGETGEDEPTIDPASPRARRARERAASEELEATPARRGMRAAAVVGIALATFAVGLAGAVYWRQQRTAQAPPPVAPPVAVAPRVDTTPAIVDSVPAKDSTPPPAPVLVVANPGDSVGASAWAVELIAANSEDGARSRLKEAGPKLPAATYAPATIGADPMLWFKVLGGALPERIQADTLLAALRKGRIVAKQGGRVIEAPFAFRLVESVRADSVPTILADYLARGLPAYALKRADGRADVLSGAFESPQQAALHVPALTAAKVEPVLVYRTGRAF